MSDFEKIERFNHELKDTGREGIDSLIDSLDAKGFYKAPCSAKYHLCTEGGLLEHSLNVLEYARKLNEAWESGIDDEHIVITALLHDIGKCGDHGKQNYIPKILKDGTQSKAEPYKTNPELIYICHEVRSVAIAERHIHLTEDEEMAILYHNGLYGAFKYDINGKETALYMILHFADLWCSRIVEVE